MGLVVRLLVRAFHILCDSKSANSREAAIASNLATGMTVEAAVKAGSRYIEAGIKTSIGLGEGNGPINHFHSSYSLPFTP
jgi:hypothetical protein